MKKILICAISFLAGSLCFAQELSGYEIAKRCDEQNEPNTASYSATLTLTDKKGRSRVREILMRSKDYGETEKNVIVFVTPEDVQGVGYLSLEYDVKADGTKPKSDNWLYMPALKKVRRISGSDTGGDFMGTDFTYDDMGDRGLNEDVYELLGEENISGNECYKVNAVSKDKTEKNPRRILYISKDNFLLIKCELFDRQDNLQRVLLCSDIIKIDGYWCTQKMVMTNVQTNHSTTMEMKNVVYDKTLDDGMFTVAAIERGSVR